ncbi:MAG: formylglycine-generating enzyme family protein [Boseongicola sp.]
MGVVRPAIFVAIPGSDFVMGSNSHYPEERPALPVSVKPFDISISAVTNREFAAFVNETGYQTTAETPLPADSSSGMPPDYFEAGSLVFHMRSKPVDLRDFRNWWRFVPGACWHAPEGPGSSVAELLDHPVVHTSIFDALAYADWAGLVLPTEAEWEFAARGGVETTYPWGDELEPNGTARANTWQGEFPWKNSRRDRPPFTMPVRAFEPNQFGLYNMIGNVWEWTCDKYSASHQTRSPCCVPGGAKDGENYVVKGGSFLCAPSYCRRYRASARSPQEARSSTSHLGFRCVRRAQSLLPGNTAVADR